MTSARPNRSDLNIDGVIQQLNIDICAAQAQILAQSGEMLSQLKSTEIALPTAYRRTVDPDGKDKIEKVSETRVPLGSLVPLGVFYISNVDVEVPISVQATDDQSMNEEDQKLSAASSENKTGASLRVSYQYRSLSDDVSPVTLQSGPFLDLRFVEFDHDSSHRRSCTARGVVEASDGETGHPLAGARVFMSVENGSIFPSVGNLNEKGEMEFRVAGPCERGGEFTNTLLVLVNGQTRRFNVQLSPEGQRQSP